MPINLVNAVVRVKVEWIGLRLTLIGRDIRSFSRGLVVNASPGDIQPRQDCSQDFSKAGSQRLLTRLSCRPMSTSTPCANDKSRWRNYFTKKQIYKSRLFNKGFYGQYIVKAFSPPEYCRLFAQKKAYQGGSRAPQDPPPPLPPNYAPARYKKLNFGLGSTCCTQIEHARDHKN